MLTKISSGSTLLGLIQDIFNRDELSLSEKKKKALELIKNNSNQLDKLEELSKSLQDLQLNEAVNQDIKKVSGSLLAEIYYRLNCAYK